MSGWTAMVRQPDGCLWRTEVDPWKVLGDEAMVAWDRDVAPLLTAEVRGFEIEDHGEKEVPLVRIRGMCMTGPQGAYSAQALWLPIKLRWESTMLGWRPWWLKSLQ